MTDSNDDIVLKLLDERETALLQKEPQSAKKNDESKETRNIQETNLCANSTDYMLNEEAREWDRFLSSIETNNGPVLGTEPGRASDSQPGAYALGPELVPHDTTSGPVSEGDTDTSLSGAEEGRANNDLNINTTGENSDLATATPVADIAEDPEGIATADPVDVVTVQIEAERNKVRAQLQTIVFVFIGFLCLAAVLLIFFLVVGFADISDTTTASSDTMNASSIDNNSSSGTITAEEYIQDLLPEYSREALVDPSGPQFRAFRWLVEDPFLFTEKYATTEWRLLQRFALATLYFACGGEGWASQAGWLDYQRHECLWDWVESDFLDYTEITAHFAGDGPCDGYTTSFANETIDSYTELKLTRNSLQGPLPREIGLLTSLQTIDLSFNALTGTLPSSALGELSALKNIAIAYNELSGSIPNGIVDIQPSAMEYLILFGYVGYPLDSANLFHAISNLLFTNCPSLHAIGTILRDLFQDILKDFRTSSCLHWVATI